MEEKTVCFEVQFDRPDIKNKVIWARTFRSTSDDNWVEFLDENGHVKSTVRTMNVLAIDRNCSIPVDPAGEQVRPAAAPAQGLQPVPNPAGPVEAAARQAAARPAPGLGDIPQQPQPLAAAGGR
ncbi:hypothetical protein [Nonomuraea rubra]|uniref:hypothetical protein n=1 Tax=Nonomuraea rubra TaxID=46180 RepID=UPI0033EA8745